MIVGANGIDAKGSGERLKMLKDYLCKEKGAAILSNLSSNRGRGSKVIELFVKEVVKLKGKRPLLYPLPQGEGR